MEYGSPLNWWMYPMFYDVWVSLCDQADKHFMVGTNTRLIILSLPTHTMKAPVEGLLSENIVAIALKRWRNVGMGNVLLNYSYWISGLVTIIYVNIWGNLLKSVLLHPNRREVWWLLCTVIINMGNKKILSVLNFHPNK